jgi:hypothetical protein
MRVTLPPFILQFERRQVVAPLKVFIVGLILFVGERPGSPTLQMIYFAAFLLNGQQSPSHQFGLPGQQSAGGSPPMKT